MLKIHENELFKTMFVLNTSVVKYYNHGL